MIKILAIAWTIFAVGFCAYLVWRDNR